MKIITKTGDSGITSLADGSKIAKSSIQIDAIGNVDELNSLIGVLLSHQLPQEIDIELAGIQNDLFDMGAELAGSSKTQILEKQVLILENLAEKHTAKLPSLEGFILPRGSKEGALFHYARNVCRKVERSVFTLAETKAVSAFVCKYLNRLSDLLFIYARVCNHDANIPDLLWQKQDRN